MTSFFSKLGLFKRHRHPVQYNVTLPDGTERQFELEHRATGETLLEASLLSVSVPSTYHALFGLAVPSTDQGMEFRWIRLQKSLSKELKGLATPGVEELQLHVRLLLYPRDHRSIVHPMAKQLMYSQVRRDLRERRLKCNAPTATKLAGLIAQAELQDFSRDMLTRRYISQLQVLPDMTVDQERAAIEEHKLFRGLSVEECIDEFLCIAQSINSYGTVTSNVQDGSNWTAVLAYGPTGIQVIMGGIQTALIQWESVIRINVRNRYLTFHTENAYNYSTLSHIFRCPSSKQCRRIANLCIIMRNHYCGSLSYQPPSRLRRFLSKRAPRQQNSKLFSDQLTTAPSRSFSMSMAHSKTAPPHLHSLGSSRSLQMRQSVDNQPRTTSPNKQLLSTEVNGTTRDSTPSPAVLPITTPFKSSTLPARTDQEASQPLPHSHTLSHHRAASPSPMTFSQPTRPPPRRRSSQPNPVSYSQNRQDSHQHYQNHWRQSPSNDNDSTPNKERNTSERPRNRRANYYRLSIPSLSSEYYQQQQQQQYQHRGHSRSYSNVQQRQQHSQDLLTNGVLHNGHQRLSRVGSRESVVTLQHQMSLAGMSQGSTSYLNPHILSLVYQSSQTETATAL